MNEDDTIQEALAILTRRLAHGEVLSSPAAARSYATIKLGHLEHEVFGVIFLTSQNTVIAYEELFRGTLTQTSVYPREVVKAALRYNAGAVMLIHNHPSGVCEPSRADELLTQRLKETLALIEVTVLDHFIVSGGASLSFAERGLI